MLSNSILTFHNTNAISNSKVIFLFEASHILFKKCTSRLHDDNHSGNLFDIQMYVKEDACQRNNKMKDNMISVFLLRAELNTFSSF